MLRTVLLATVASAALTSAALAQTAPQAAGPTPAPAVPQGRAAPAPAAPAAPQGQTAPAAGTVEAVTVTGQRSDFRSSIDRRSYSVANDLRATSGSVADALRNVPSVEVDVQGNVSLRGDQNVTIMIDGKPSGMFSGEGRGDALQQLPADQIDRVEVMTNPSAAFRPDGSGGVINLVTKKNRRPGRYATVRGNVGTGERYNGGVSGAYTSEKLTLSGDAGFRRDRQSSSADSERERLVGGQWVENRQRSASENRGGMTNLRVGADYDPNAANRLSAEVRRRSFGFDSEASETYEFEDAAGAIARAFERRAEGGVDRSNTGATASWRRKFSGTEHELVTDLSVERTEATREFDATLTDTVPTPSVSYEDIRNEQQQDQARLKIDYTRPLPGEAKVRTGYEFELSDNTYDNSGVRSADPDSTTPDPNLTNRFLYEQTVHAVYGTFERPLGDFAFQAGLRVEQVDVRIDQVTLGTTAENDYFKAYPSLHLRYDLSEQQQLSASYSLRVQRPRAEDLNPYVIYIDPFNQRSGNPRLEPQETHSFELGWQYRRAQTFYLATGYYRESYKGVTDVVRDIGGGVLLTTRENLGERRSGGLELVANGSLTPKLTYNVSGNAFWEEIEASALGFGESRSGTSVSGRANLNWQPTPKDFFQLNAFMRGRQVTPQGYTEPMGMLNLGYRRKVDEKLSLVFTAQDVLNTLRQRSVIDTPTLRDRTERRFSNRAVFAGFTYNFSEGPRRPQRDPGFEFDTGAGGGG